LLLVESEEVAPVVEVADLTGRGGSTEKKLKEFLVQKFRNL